MYDVELLENFYRFRINTIFSYVLSFEHGIVFVFESFEIDQLKLYFISKSTPHFAN